MQTKTDTPSGSVVLAGVVQVSGVFAVISVRTVEAHRFNLMRRLQVRNAGGQKGLIQGTQATAHSLCKPTARLSAFFNVLTVTRRHSEALICFIKTAAMSFLVSYLC